MQILTYALSPPGDAWFNVNIMQSCLCRAPSGFALWNSAIKKIYFHLLLVESAGRTHRFRGELYTLLKTFQEDQAPGHPCGSQSALAFSLLGSPSSAPLIARSPSEWASCMPALISDSALGTDPSQPSSHSCLLTSTFYPRLTTPEMLHLALQPFLSPVPWYLGPWRCPPPALALETVALISQFQVGVWGPMGGSLSNLTVCTRISKNFGVLC